MENNREKNRLIIIIIIIIIEYATAPGLKKPEPEANPSSPCSGMSERR